jgi:hypothetical protein
MMIRRIESLVAITFLWSGCKPALNGSSLAISGQEYCETDAASKIVRVQPARISSSIIMYSVKGKACSTNRKTGFTLADPVPAKDPVVILYYPSMTNLSQKQHEALQNSGQREFQPEFAGPVAGKDVMIGGRESQRIIMPRADTKESNAYPEGSFAEKEAITLYSDLQRSGVPVKLIDASQSNAQITAQSNQFLSRTSSTNYNLLYLGHSSSPNGTLEANRSIETIKVGQHNGQPVVKDYKVEPQAVGVADKMNAVMAGSNIQPYCMSRSCFSDSLKDDGLDKKAKQLMTFSTDKTVASSIPAKDPSRYADGMTEILRDHLTGGQDQNSDGAVDLKDLKATMECVIGTMHICQLSASANYAVLAV